MVVDMDKDMVNVTRYPKNLIMDMDTILTAMDIKLPTVMDMVAMDMVDMDIVDMDKVDMDIVDMDMVDMDIVDMNIILPAMNIKLPSVMDMVDIDIILPAMNIKLPAGMDMVDMVMDGTHYMRSQESYGGYRHHTSSYGHCGYGY